MDLSPQEHEALIEKVVAVFESDMDQKGPDDAPATVTSEQLFQHRWVIHSWVRTVGYCARADLDENKYQSVEQAVLRGALDNQPCQLPRATLWSSG